ncbi:hypothetical protein [Nevskia ramosa]|uniref:hypothetical protein n=1 Tax=Nevskia ramosa TaxID=64002 RepID=UPI002356776D|nr:hypothetical protein [Nevskia ramosa]
MQKGQGVPSVNLPETPLEIGDNHELLYYALGPIWADAPCLWKARHEPGASTQKAVDFLLERIEHRMPDSQNIRALLAGCFGELETPVELTHLWQLGQDSKPAAHAVLEWVGSVGGLQLDDFQDGGVRFLRLVLRKRPQTIARMVVATGATC